MNATVNRKPGSATFSGVSFDAHPIAEGAQFDRLERRRPGAKDV